MSAVSEIVGCQAKWAIANEIPFDRSHVCSSVESNRFQPLNPETRVEYARGAGDELGTMQRPGSMASLRSSAALVVNVFDAWRDSDLGELSAAIGAELASNRIRFEVTYPTGLRGIPPHLDVVIDQKNGPPLAVESKFTEPYGEVHNEFRPSYFAKPEIWADLTRTRDLAHQISEGAVKFRYLGAAQLIKHALGLARAHGAGGFRLLYLWYEWPGEIAATHRDEIGRFIDLVGTDFDVAAMTYQTLFKKLKGIPEPKPGYCDYLERRYFPGT